MKIFNENKRVWWILSGILILALGLRAVIFMKYLHSFNLQTDAKNYFLMSHQLVDKGIFGYWFDGNKFGGSPGVSNARVTPGYPLFISIAYFIFHNPYLQITVTRLFQVFIGGFLTPLLGFLFAKRAMKRNDIALVTAFFMAIYPTYIFSTIQLLTEVLSLFTMLLYFYFMLLGFEKKKLYLNVLAGGLFALHILVRPALLPMFIVPFIFAGLEWKKGGRTELVKIFVQTLAGFVLVMSPWWIRNYLVLHQLILTAGGTGNPLLAGTYPYLKYGMEGYMADVPDRIKGISNLQAEFAKERIIRGFSTEPLLYLKWYTLGKIQFMFGTAWLQYMVVKTKEIHGLIHSFIVWVGFTGVIFSSIKFKLSRYLNLYGLIFLVIYLAFDPQPRYTYQHMFFLMFSAAILICFAKDKIKQMALQRGV